MRATGGARNGRVAPDFDPAAFTATEYASAAEKAAFATQLARFIDGGFTRTSFTHPLYRRLCTMFGHIAHYDRDGFYATWFATDGDRVRFLENVLGWRAPGSARFTFCDVERTITTWLAESGLVETLRERAVQALEAADLESLASLVRRYPEQARRLVVDETLARSR